LDDVLIDDKEVIKEILSKFDNDISIICLYDASTNEKIFIDNKLNKNIRTYYKDKLIALEIRTKRDMR
jgi:hypothetical protein